MDMKKIKILSLILIFCLALALTAPGALAAEGEELAPPELDSAAAVVADANTGRVLYAYNADEQRYPASLTKVMTVLLAVEAIERGEVTTEDAVTAGQEALEGMIADGSTAGIQPGETMTLGDLMYCAMLGSANEACNIIAVHISGSLAAFVEDMNERAAELGCTGTHFTNTHGLPDANHHTTARDFTLITLEAMSHDLFFEISGTVNYTVPATNMSEERQLSNSNGLINPECQIYPGNYYEYARAGKTGHTNDAGYCLASLAEREEVRLVAVVLGGSAVQNDSGWTYTNFSDSRTLYNWVFNNFSMTEVLSTTELVTSVKVNLAENDGMAVLRPAEAVRALVPDKGFDPAGLERDIVIFSERDGSELTAPIAAGTVLGELTLKLDGVELGSCSLVTSGAVELARSEFMKMEIAGFFGNIWVQLIIIALLAALALYILSVVRYRKLHKRHLLSVAEAEARAAERRREEERGPAQPVPQSEERAAVTAGAPRRAAPRAAPHDTGELDKTIVRPSPGSAPASPRPGRPQTPVRGAEQRPSGRPPAGDKARRDYFEEFFRQNGTNSRGGEQNKQ